MADRGAHSGSTPHWSQPDVLIVGAGASGAAVAWSLAGAGFRVVCLEQGGWVDPTTLPANGDDWELRRLTDFNPDPNVRQLPADYPVNDVDSTFTPLMFNAVGGSTIHWSGHFPRYHPSDFRVRSLDGVGDDWPLTYEELEPFYDRNDRVIGVSGVVGDPSQPPRSARPTAPLPIGTLGATMARGFDKLGWHWWVSDGAAISEPYGETPGRRPCNLCGPCDLGCPIGALSSANVTYWPLAVRLGVELRTGCRVREITIGADGLARGALYYGPDGGLHEQTAPLVILACNGVGTPRLLLNSRSRHFPDGLANRSGLVGKNLMFHPFAAVGGVFPDLLDSYKGPIGTVMFSHEFYETDPARDFVRGYGLQVVRHSGPVSVAGGGFTATRVPWGRDHHRVFAERFSHLINIGVMGEDLPETINEVTLDPELSDGDGIPAPLVRYRLSDNSKRMLDHGVARAGEALLAAGATQVLTMSPLRPSGWHLLGTCRMGDFPMGSVVDRWGRAHDVPNLFIVDGSTFVTSAAVNPTTTIQALALRTADHIKQTGKSAIGHQLSGARG
ncbi:MAG: GMC family oxidoreductase [Solirubrobacterales bacterium]|nr:GMC family oxidoreductase [Solirubrobacterales bacterium]